MREIYRARKIVKRHNLVLCDSIVYLVKDGRQITDSEQDIIVLPRENINKKGTFWDNFYYGTKNQCTKYYKILERVN